MNTFFYFSKVPAFLNVVDIAGLVKGAAEGQGLGNAFLSHIKACDAIFNLCRKYTNILNIMNGNITTSIGNVYVGSTENGSLLETCDEATARRRFFRFHWRRAQSRSHVFNTAYAVFFPLYMNIYKYIYMYKYYIFCVHAQSTPVSRP